MKLQHFLSFLFGQYQVMMREKGRVVETVEALASLYQCSWAGGWWWVYDLSNLVFGVKASYQCIRLWLRCVVFIVNWITGHFHVLITSQTMSEGWACLVLLDLILMCWPLGLQTKLMMLCVLSSCCMYVCVCVVDFGYHYALLYQGFSVERVIFLDI